jgi:uncharacterized hydrophobic protein (TIGR00271 family)
MSAGRAASEALASAGQMVHLRIIAPRALASAALEEIERQPGACNVVVLPGAAIRPQGDLILCDIAREAASFVIGRLRELGVADGGAITVESIETQLSAAAAAAGRAAPGAPGDAVVWEQVEAHTAESVRLTAGFLLFMVLATLIAAVGIFLDSPILIVGAMVVGPEFGPLAGICVALVERRPRLALTSLEALAVGFPVAIAAACLAAAAFKATGITAEVFTGADHSLSEVIASPDFFTVFVAFCAGVAGTLSLTTAKSSVLIGVLISVTTIPAAANVGVAAAYGDWSACLGSLGQLGLNLGTIIVAGSLTLAVQYAVTVRRGRELSRLRAIRWPRRRA